LSRSFLPLFLKNLHFLRHPVNMRACKYTNMLIDAYGDKHSTSINALNAGVYKGLAQQAVTACVQ
jgi:hypothetical protein